MESIPRPVRHLEENTVCEKSGVFCLREMAAQSTFERVGNEDNCFEISQYYRCPRTVEIKRIKLGCGGKLPVRCRTLDFPFLFVIVM